MSKNTNRLVSGWGINDVHHPVTRTKLVGGKQKRVWVCPYYKKWHDMLKRCFDAKLQERCPTYVGCTISEDWKYLSNFITWVDNQPNRNWANCQLDKDLLSVGNKHYGPDTVVFISSNVNKFMVNSGKSRGKFMLGVNQYPHKKKNPYKASCKNPFGKGSHIGLFSTEIEAHKAW